MTTLKCWDNFLNQLLYRNCYTLAFEQECQRDLSTDYTFWNFTCSSKQTYCQAKGYEFWDKADDECYRIEGGNTGNAILKRVDRYEVDNSFVSRTVSDPFRDVLQESSISPAEDYLNGRVLGLTLNIEGDLHTWKEYGKIQWELALCLMLTWILVTMILIRGVRSLGKAAYVITLSPYFVLTALLAYSATLPGAGNGISYFLTPEWEKLGEIRIWSQAASQILFSLSVGFGSQLVLASYNKFENNTHRDTFLIAICNSLTSIYAGFVVFSILGFLEYQTQTDIENVVQQGINLAFISYPTAILEMDVPPLWSFLFFFMLINLALSSICGGMQVLMSFITDEKPSLKKYRLWILIGLSVIFYLSGLTMVTNGGIHLFTLFNDRCTNSLLFLTFLEVSCPGLI